jgi:hypothetical protein
MYVLKYSNSNSIFDDFWISNIRIRILLSNSNRILSLFWRKYAYILHVFITFIFSRLQQKKYWRAIFLREFHCNCPFLLPLSNGCQSSSIGATCSPTTTTTCCPTTIYDDVYSWDEKTWKKVNNRFIVYFIYFLYT